MRNCLSARATIVADEFIDRYMPDANGEYVKVYLYLLRHQDRVVTEVELADALNRTESDIRRAVAYWERLGVLAQSGRPAAEDRDGLNGAAAAAEEVRTARPASAAAGIRSARTAGAVTAEETETHQAASAAAGEMRTIRSASAAAGTRSARTAGAVTAEETEALRTTAAAAEEVRTARPAAAAAGIRSARTAAAVTAEETEAHQAAAAAAGEVRTTRSASAAAGEEAGMARAEAPAAEAACAALPEREPEAARKEARASEGGPEAEAWDGRKNTESGRSEENGSSAAAVGIPAQRPQYTPEQVSRLADEEDFTQLLYIAQKYMNKVFTPRECEVFAYLYDGLKMPSEVLDYLVEYCVQGGHSSIRYLETVAINWHERGIRTVEDARRHTASFSNEAFAVMKAFGLNDRRPGDTELETIRRWFQEWGFSRELVMEACGRTLRATQKPSFSYADRILEEWKKAGVRTRADVERLDRGRENRRPQAAGRSAGTPGARNRFHNFEQRDTNYDALVLERLKERLSEP